MILDHHGQPIDLAAIREPQTARVAHLQREFDSHPARGLTPARLQSILGRAEQGDLIGQLELADDIEERDGHVFAELCKRRGVITALEWDVHAPDDATAAEQALADEVDEWLESLPEFGDVLLGMSDAMLKGFAMHEMVWVPDGPGRLHARETTEELRPGSTFRLRPRQVHIVENLSASQQMTVIGIFTPAGSPSAAFLMPDVAAEYRFSG